MAILACSCWCTIHTTVLKFLYLACFDVVSVVGSAIPVSHWPLSFKYVCCSTMIQISHKSSNSSRAKIIQCINSGISYSFVGAPWRCLVAASLISPRGFSGGHQQNHTTISMITLLLVMPVMHTVLHCCILLGMKLLRLLGSLLTLHNTHFKLGPRPTGCPTHRPV